MIFYDFPVFFCMAVNPGNKNTWKQKLEQKRELYQKEAIITDQKLVKKKSGLR